MRGAITIVLYLTFFAYANLRAAKRPITMTSGEELFAGDLVLLLLPLTPVIQYILNNRDILYPYESILVFLVLTLFITFLIFVLPTLFRKTGSRRTVMFLGLAVAFSITNMASLSLQFAWHETGSLWIQLPVFAGVFLVSWFLFHLNYRTLLYLLVAGYFLTSTISQLSARGVGSYASDPVGNNSSLVTLIGSREPEVTPNVCLLVYDAYVANETMLAYGIDNGPQEQYLEDLDFQMYPQTYSVAPWSNATMSRVINASLNYYRSSRKGVSGDGVVQNLLKEFGYNTYGVFSTPYFFKRIVPSYDYSFPGYSSSANTLLKAIFEGEFKFDIDYDKVSRDQFLEQKTNIISELSEDPKFVYMHSNYPNHSQTSGVLPT